MFTANDFTAPTPPPRPAMILDVLDGDCTVDTCTLDAFVAANDGLADDEIDAIAALAVGEVYTGGGGAGALWAVRRASSPTPTPRRPRAAILPPGADGPHLRHPGALYLSGSDHEINGRTAESIGVAGLEVTAWLPSYGTAPTVYRIERVWEDDTGPDMTGRQVEAWIAAHPDLAADITEHLCDRGADADEQRRELGGWR